MTARRELLVVVDTAARTARVFENTDTAQQALAEWVKLTETYAPHRVAPLHEFMHARGVRAYTIATAWDLDL